MSQKQTHNKWFTIVAITTCFAIVIGIYYFVKYDSYTLIVNQLTKEKEGIKLFHEKAMTSFERISESDYERVSEIKIDLKNTIEEINSEKKEISRYQYDYKKYLNDAHEIDSAILNHVGLENNDKQKKRYNELLRQNVELRKQNRTLELEAVKNITLLEDEKKFNANLNAAIIILSNQLKSMKAINNQTNMNEFEEIKIQKERLEKELEISNQKLKNHTYELRKMSDIIRKSQTDCYFYYRESELAQNIKVYITEDGISNLYADYFRTALPDVYLQFKITPYRKNQSDSVDLIIKTEKGDELFNVPTKTTGDVAVFKLRGSLFGEGKYHIMLKSNGENLLWGDEYVISFTNKM